MKTTVKVVIAVIVTLLISAVGMFFLALYLESPVAIPYTDEKYNFAENLSVEVDDNGDVYLTRKNEAAGTICNYGFARYSGTKYEGFTLLEAKKVLGEADGLGINLVTQRFNYHSQIKLPEWHEKLFLFNTNDYPKVREVFYYDENTGTEYPIWSR